MMRSGGNFAPIDRQRSWSHSWMCESAGRGGGGAGERRGRRRDEFLLDSSKKTNLIKHTHGAHNSPALVPLAVLRMRLFPPLYRHTCALFGPLCAWEVCGSEAAHWERVTAFYFYRTTHRVMERRAGARKKFWILEARRSRAGGERERESFDRKR